MLKLFFFTSPCQERENVHLRKITLRSGVGVGVGVGGGWCVNRKSDTRSRPEQANSLISESQVRAQVLAAWMKEEASILVKRGFTNEDHTFPPSACFHSILLFPVFIGSVDVVTDSTSRGAHLP